jgi:hypothetical protein
MEIIEQRYYDPKRLTNSTYLIMMALETYIGQEIFKGDGSRIFYGSDSFAFRQRMNKLYPTINTGITSVTASQLQFPFCNYFRASSWKIDTRPAIQNATAALYGFQISNDIPVNVRFLQTEMDFNLTFYFNRDDDAQNCYDILMWIQNPSPKQFPWSGMQYKNYKIDIPVIMTTSNISWTNQYKENEWLQKNRIIVVKADINIKSVVLDQFAQGSKSGLFEILPADSDIGKYYITREALLDFLSFKKEPLLDKENIVFDIIANFTPDPELTPTLTISDIIETGFKVSWNYNEDALELYEPNVTILLDSGIQAIVPITDKEKVFEGLEPESTYVMAIYFTSLSGKIIKLTETINTVIPENQKELKGMIGLEF